MNIGKSIDVRYIKVDATPGSHINAAIADAVILAMQEGVDVKLIHNDKVHEISSADIADCISQRGVKITDSE